MIVKIVIVVVLLILLFLTVLHYKQKRYVKRLNAKKIIIAEKDHQLHELSTKANGEKFDQLTHLAKLNSPEFLTLFIELYPEFVLALKKLDPGIKSPELTFCGMLYLNFTTKDIAEYTFVTIRAVQIRKNRLRKKYHIDSETDINDWMRNLSFTNTPPSI